MRSSRRIAGPALFAVGAAALAWLLYDASHVRETLGLGAFASEGAVALAGLAFGMGALCAGALLWWKSRGRRPAGCSAE